jgi:hypothetical protein
MKTRVLLDSLQNAETFRTLGSGNGVRPKRKTLATAALFPCSAR